MRLSTTKFCGKRTIRPVGYLVAALRETAETVLQDRGGSLGIGPAGGVPAESADSARFAGIRNSQSALWATAFFFSFLFLGGSVCCAITPMPLRNSVLTRCMKDNVQPHPKGKNAYRAAFLEKFRTPELKFVSNLHFVPDFLESGRRKSGLHMISVPGGTFTMGCQDGRDQDCRTDEKPAHSVTLSDFQIGKYEVTQADWRSVMGDNPAYFSGCDDCPVESVSCDDIRVFLEKLNAKNPGKNYRLPTEAEWEYAARGGAKSKGFLYAGGMELDKVAWYEGNSSGKTHPVGSKAPNELGLYDMSGNAWEWCSDRYGEYSSAAQTNPVGAESGGLRVLRGGGWNFKGLCCRASYRFLYAPNCRINLIGFRLVASGG